SRVVETLVLGRLGWRSYTEPMFLRRNRRLKDGKQHDYWSVVENRRLSDGRVVQRQVLYLGEINASQREAWRKTIEVQDEGRRRQVALFPAGSMPADDVDAIGVRLSELRLERPRQWGACWAVVRAVAATRSGQLLASPAAALARGHAVAAGVADAGGLSTHRPRLRVATAPALVRCECHGRSTQCRLRIGREEHAVPLPGQAGGAQGRAVQVSRAALG